MVETLDEILRKALEYSNFDVKVGLGQSAYGLFDAAGGNLLFFYDGTLYGVGPLTLVYGRPVIYVPEDTTDVVKAIKDRLEKYFTVDFIFLAISITSSFSKFKIAIFLEV